MSFLSFPLVMGFAMRFLWEIFLKVFYSGQSDVRSGNSMPTCCVVNANILNMLIQLDNSKHRSRAISRLSEGRKIPILSCNIDYLVSKSMFAFTKQHVVIEVPERTSECQEPKTFKTISHKKHIAIPMTRGRDKRLTMP